LKAEDARAALLIYKLLRKDWERYIRRQMKAKWRRSSSKKKKNSNENNDTSTIKSEENEEHNLEDSIDNNDN
jgi:ribosomal protein L12E/L44/L45/RPP1/RPP2